MHKPSHFFSRCCFALVFASMAVVLSACGSGGGGGSTAAQVPSKVVVQDAAIVGALVKDALGRTATATSRGVYEFLDENSSSYEPRLPISVISQNVFTNGAIATGDPVTFQDLDRNGVFSAGDIAFNGTFDVRYAIPGSTTVYANPVSALIPANWNGTSSIAGLSSTVLQASISTSVETSTNAQLKQAAAMLTAISDSLGATLSANGMNNTTISTTLKSLLVAIGAAANVNLLDAAAASNLGTVAANVVVAAGASSSQAAATNLATNIQSLSLATGALNNYEAIVQVAQDSTSLRDATYSVDAGKFQVQNQDLTIQNARAVVVNGLRLVPFCDLIVGQTVACNPTEVGPWLAFTRLTGFQLTAVNGSIRVNGSGDLFTSFSFTNGMVADYRAASGSWKYIQPNVSSVMEISLGVSFKDPTDVVRTGNLLQICNASGSCVPYYLADRAGVCSLVSGDSTGLLAKINALNAPALNTTCP